jgi:hypothetical protein
VGDRHCSKARPDRDAPREMAPSAYQTPWIGHARSINSSFKSSLWTVGSLHFFRYCYDNFAECDVNLTVYSFSKCPCLGLDCQNQAA